MGNSRTYFMRALLLLGTAALAAQLTAPRASAQGPPPTGANSDPTYQQLRNVTLGSESFAVDGAVLKRDAATLHLDTGTVCFVTPVNGKVTGAVFVGKGRMSFDPPNADERRSLKLLTKSDEFAETFTHLVLRFTDSTDQELRGAGVRGNGNCDSGLLRDSQNVMRHHRKYNLDARILEDVLRGDPGGLFVAFVHGENYDGKLIYIIDPNGAPSVAPEQVELTTSSENNFGIWSAFPFSSEYKLRLGAGAASASRIHIESQQLDTMVENNAYLSGKAKTTFVALTGSGRVVPFDLFNTLRVQEVRGPEGQPLAFVQEDKNDDADFSVILPKALAQGEKYTITTTYGGKDAVVNYYNDVLASN